MYCDVVCHIKYNKRVADNMHKCKVVLTHTKYGISMRKARQPHSLRCWWFWQLYLWKSFI